MKKYFAIGFMAMFLLSVCNCVGEGGGEDDNDCCLFEDTITFTLAEDSPIGAISPGGDRVLMAIDINCKQSECWIAEMTFDFSANPACFYQFWLEDDNGVISENSFEITHTPWTWDQEMVFNLSYTVGRTKRIYLVAPLYEEDFPDCGESNSFQPIMTGSVSTAFYGAPDLYGNNIYADF